jgi:hypothetical protein
VDRGIGRLDGRRLCLHVAASKGRHQGLLVGHQVRDGDQELRHHVQEGAKL